MDYSVEVLKIIEGCVKFDKDKVYNYTNLLIRKLKEDGDEKFANRLDKVISGMNRTSLNAVSANTLYKIPVDSESRLPIADVLVPNEIDENAVFLNDSCEEQINLFFKYYNNRNKIVKSGINMPNTLIFYGPPGCGKTKLAQYVSKNVGLPLITTRLDGLISSYLGSTAKNIRAIFDYAQNVPCVLFLDEFDAIAKIRDDANELGELKRIVNSLLQNIDSIKNGSIIIAATNHEKLLDPAVWRRFMFRINILKPEENVRKNIINNCLSDFKLSDKYLKILSSMFEGFSGAEIEQVCEKVKMDCIVYNKEISLNMFLNHFFAYKPIDLENLSNEKELLKKQMEYLKSIDEKNFSYTVLADIFGISKSYVSQIFKEVNV